MVKSLSPGVIGVDGGSLVNRIALAAQYGFDGVELDIAAVADQIDSDGVAAVRALFGQVKPAGFGLPTAWRGSDEEFGASLLQLPRLAAAAEAIGCTRTFTWILPGSNDRPKAENRAFHVSRFRPIAATLAAHDIRLGLEFIGPKTSRDAFAHPFLYRAGEMLAMGREIGPNVGLLLDSWHWYTSGGTVANLVVLKAEDIVYVHVNDAPAGVSLEDQQDGVRCVPGSTGVLPIEAFFKALRRIGYDGPIVAEPFSQELRDLPSDADRLRVISDSLDQVMAR